MGISFNTSSKNKLASLWYRQKTGEVCRVHRPSQEVPTSYLNKCYLYPDPTSFSQTNRSPRLWCRQAFENAKNTCTVRLKLKEQIGKRKYEDMPFPASQSTPCPQLDGYSPGRQLFHCVAMAQTHQEWSLWNPLEECHPEYKLALRQAFQRDQGDQALILKFFSLSLGPRASSPF